MEEEELTEVEESEDFYEEEDQEEALEDDELNPEEAGFMQGYEEADNPDKEEPKAEETKEE